MKGEFFAIGLPQFKAACRLGMNPAIAFLVMARGSQGDNSTTAWSGHSVYNRTGISRRRAKAAVECLIKHGLAQVVRREPKPTYKLQKPDNDQELIWLPNTLIEGAGEEIPPIVKLREYGDLTLLEKFISLYHEHDLDGDGGLPRTLARTDFSRTRIDDIGPFTLYGFQRGSSTANSIGLLSELKSHVDESGYQGAWAILAPLEELGLLNEAVYMAESGDYESELIYPFTNATQDAIEHLWGWIHDQELHGCIKKYEAFDYFGVALRHVRNACLVGCFRLHYRPHTSKTSRWWAEEKEQEETMTGLIRRTCSREPIYLCAHQG